MLCVVIKGVNFSEIYQQISAVINKCSLVEIRLDYVKEWDEEAFQNLKKQFSIPIILTLRSLSQGGYFFGSDEEYEAKILEIVKVQPDYIDIESFASPTLVEKIKKGYPKVKIIISYHDFEKMPDLKEVFLDMQRLSGDLYKIAAMPHSSKEALYLLQFMRSHSPKVMTMGMGLYGESTRILAPIFKAPFIYTFENQEMSTATGQVSIEELMNTYNVNFLSDDSSIYGLIGDPVDKSISHITHNSFMHLLEINAVYLKFPVSKQELPNFLPWAKSSGIKGLSVTMPLKEEILPFLDYIDPYAKKIGAVNTLVIREGRILGYNTDGKGALDAIESKVKVKGKKMIIMGAGGAAKALAHEAVNRGAEIIMLSRNKQRALSFADLLGFRVGTLEEIAQEFEAGYDILVNATPNSMPIDVGYIIPGTVAMDLTTYPQYTTFLKCAREKNCDLVFGYEMFVGQAVGQFELWFHDLVNARLAFDLLNNKAASCL